MILPTYWTYPLTKCVFLLNESSRRQSNKIIDNRYVTRKNRFWPWYQNRHNRNRGKNPARCFFLRVKQLYHYNDTDQEQFSVVRRIGYSKLWKTLTRLIDWVVQHNKSSSQSWESTRDLLSFFVNILQTLSTSFIFFDIANFCSFEFWFCNYEQ